LNKENISQECEIYLPDEIIRVAERYIESRKLEIPKLYMGIEKNDFFTLHFFAQHVANTSKNFGLDRLIELASGLEIEAANSDVEKAKVCVDEIKAHLDSIELKSASGF
jgi:hypothetical protein